MSVFISLKKSIVFLLCGFVCAAGMAFLLNFFLAGPRLGPVYDFFLSRRHPPPISREILIINTDEFVESGDIFSVLMTLTEMEASNLILSARVSGSSSPVTGTESEIRLNFLDEYALLGNNIRNLFQAIRSGSVPPSQAPVYVERLVDLTEQSRERLLSRLIDRDEDLIRSAAVFGNFLETDIRPKFDRDGKLRRVHPMEKESSLEHPVFQSLKERYAAVQFERGEHGQVLLFRGHDGGELRIPLDRDGNIIAAGLGSDFRGINITLFREYEEAGRAMRRVLKEADDLGAFSRTQPEYSPLLLEDYALVLREEMLKSPDSEKRAAWIASRASYIESLYDFLYGPAEMILVSGYEEIIADEKSLDEKGIAKLADMRDKMINSFFAMREKHNELSIIHEKLKEELASSFCIMGPQNNAAYCALLANVMITGSHIKPVYDRYALYLSVAAAFIILFIIFRMRPSVLLFAGLGLGALAAAAFGWTLVIGAYWIEPVVVFGASVSGMFVIFCCRRATLRRRARLFRAAYGSAVSADVLRELIAQGMPRPCDVYAASAAVIAIKDFNLLRMEDRERPMEAGKAARSFFAAVKKAVFEADGVIAGYERDTVIACFGSPLETFGSDEDPVKRAYNFVKKLTAGEKKSWCFGIDSGECTFSWSPETGFCANGRPVVRAKILVSRTARLKVRALITDAIREKTILNVKKIDYLYDKNDPVFEMTVLVIKEQAGEKQLSPAV
jgi:hypothetical protein